jgi:hypothetical protein
VQPLRVYGTEYLLARALSSNFASGMLFDVCQ